MTLPMSHTRRAALAAAAVLSAAALPSAASAQPYEQVSRTTGPYSTALAANLGVGPAAVGDVGRLVAFQGSFSNGLQGAFVRDVRTNLTTQPGGSATKQIWGFDRAETKALISRVFNDRVELAITPLVGGGTSKVVYTAPTPNGPRWYGDVPAVLSGDGGTVVFADNTAVSAQGTYVKGPITKIDVATGARTTLPAPPAGFPAWELSPYGQAVSDDGKTVAVRTAVFANGQVAEVNRVYIDGQAPIETPSQAIVGPNGTAAWGNPATGNVVARKPNGTLVTLGGGGEAYGKWLSADGTKLLTKFPSSDGVIQQWDVAQGGWWTPITGPYATLSGLWSPNGKFVLRNDGKQTFLVDRTGAEIPGAEDPISADNYIKLSATYSCGSVLGPLFGKNYGDVIVTLFRQPVPYAAKSSKATVQLYVDTSLLKTATINFSETVKAPFKGSPKNYRTAATVTDELGRVVNATISQPFSQCG